MFCGVCWAKIGGHQAETIPNLPIYPRTPDLYKKTQKIARENVRKQQNKNLRLLAFERKDPFFQLVHWIIGVLVGPLCRGAAPGLTAA